MSETHGNILISILALTAHNVAAMCEAQALCSQTCQAHARLAQSLDRDLDEDHAVYLLQSAGRAVQRLNKQVAQTSSQNDTVGKSLAKADDGFSTFPIIFGITLCSLLAIPLLRHRAESIREHSKYAAEFFGTFALVFTVGCCSLCGSNTWSATAIGCVLMVMVYATASISGGHLNPAVSFSLAICDKLAWTTMFGYWAAQMLAGVVASCCFTTLFWPKPIRLGPVAPFQWYHAIVVELIYTCMLCFVVNNCAFSKRNNKPDDGNQFFALAIGFVIVAGGYASGGVSGACFNPAVSIALDISDPSDGMHWCFLWILAELLGAAIAALGFRALRPEDYFTDASQYATYEPSLRKKVVSEFLGTFILVLTVGLNIVMGSPAVAFSAAAALMCMIYSLGDISGGHFNPSVTVAVVMSRRGKCSFAQGRSYCEAQLTAGVFASLLIAWFHASSPFSSLTFGLGPGAHYTIIAAGVAEAFYTFVLAYVVLAVATVKKPSSQLSAQNFFFALCIGSCVTVGGFAIGHVSGGELNPAVSLALSISSVVHKGAMLPPPFLNFIIFGIFELLGGCLAALVFHVTHASQYSDTIVSDAVAKWACEFVGTFSLIFTVICVEVAGDAVWGVTSIGCVLMVMIYATGPVSGGKLNPSVSLSLALCGKLTLEQMALEWLAQITGGILAGFLACALFFPKYAAVAPVAPYLWYHALVVEVIYTFMICFVVNNCAASNRNNSKRDGNQFYALAIGYVIIAGGYAGGKVSGAAFNPAVAIGLDISGYADGVGWGFAWACFELIGACLAALGFRIVRREDFTCNTDEELAAYKPTLLTRCISEFLGSFILVFTVGMNIISSSGAVAWSAAAALTCMVYSLGDVSGGHFNPAVTLSVVMCGREKCSLFAGLWYCTVQMAAGACAGVLYAWFHFAGSLKDVTFGLAPAAGYTWYSAGFAELFFTMFLAYTVLACATVVPAGAGKTQQNFYFALCIGSSVMVGGSAISAVSGGELNPAVSLGISTASAVHRGATQPPTFENFLLFGLWELAGGLLAAVLFHVTNATEYVKREPTFSSS